MHIATLAPGAVPIKCKLYAVLMNKSFLVLFSKKNKKKRFFLKKEAKTLVITYLTQ